MNSRILLVLVCGLLAAATAAVVTGAQEREVVYLPDLPVKHPAIRYFQREVDDPIARLNQALKSGKASMEIDEEHAELGYLPALLREVGINTDAQALVFSRTSFQARKIGPDNPRAIYFNDEVAVAYVRGSEEIEVAAIDPEVGPIFYTANLNTIPTEGFERREVCLQCHLGPATSGVPGIFVGSVFPGPSGSPSPVDAIITDHRTEFKDRWGGWYVNATRGQQEDRSNSLASNPAQPLLLDEVPRNLTHLYGKFDADNYLARLSDIVALMTFEHQTQMTNYFTRVGWEWRMIQFAGDKDQFARAQMEANIEALVDYMLFVDEEPLPEPVEGVSTFTETFPQRGPRDSKGRSLRDFDLQTRLFRYPLSYMIYSKSFDRLPDPIRERIYRRLWDVLTGVDQSERFAGLQSEDRRAIIEIVRDTKQNLPGYWHESTLP